MTMSNPRKLIVGSGLTALSLIYASVALAGSATMESTGGERVVFEYADGNKLRINTSEEGNYMVVRDGTLFAVSDNNGQPMVINASSMMKGFGQIAKMTEQAAPTGAMGEVLSVTATGRSETVAGVSGEVYEIVTRENGERVSKDAVLSSDARALELRDAMFTMISASMEALDEDMRRHSDDFRKRLNDMNMGLLRFGTEMKITSITGDTVPSSRFELPAKPVDMNNLGGLMEAFGGAGASNRDGAGDADNGIGSLFSGMMEKLGGAETDGDGASSDEDDSSAAAKAGKALKGLFGRK